MRPSPFSSTGRAPEASSIEHAPERALLHVLATTARCARMSVMTEFRDLFDVPPAGPPPDCPPHALDLAARQLVAHLDDVLAALDLYELALRQHLLDNHDDLL